MLGVHRPGAGLLLVVAIVVEAEFEGVGLLHERHVFGEGVVLAVVVPARVAKAPADRRCLHVRNRVGQVGMRIELREVGAELVPIERIVANDRQRLRLVIVGQDGLGGQAWA